MGIGSSLLVITGIGGLALRTKRRTPVHSADCGGGQLAGQPRAVLTDLTTQLPAPTAVSARRGPRTPDGAR